MMARVPVGMVPDGEDVVGVEVDAGGGGGDNAELVPGGGGEAAKDAGGGGGDKVDWEGGGVITAGGVEA